jgi:hypothetical protein
MNIDDVYNYFKTADIKNYDILFDNCELKNYTTETLLFVLYDLYQYEPSKDKIEEKIKRTLQKNFREKIIKKYNKCIITDRSEKICEACHIIPFSDSQYNEKYDVFNGILLCRDLHSLFDKYLISINPVTGCFELSDSIISDNDFTDYHKYNGKKIKIDDKRTCEYLEKHYELFKSQN